MATKKSGVRKHREGISAEAGPKDAGGEIGSAPEDAVRDKSELSRKIIHHAIKFNVLFMNLDPAAQDRIIDQMYRVEVAKGTSVITQGETGNNLYIVDAGQFHVFVSGVRVAIRGKGTCFGELALMYNSPRAATVTASQDSVVWIVDRVTFRRAVRDLNEEKIEEYKAIFASVTLLASLDEGQREKLAEALEEVEVAAGGAIFNQGDEGDAMYIIHKGSCVVLKCENGEEPVEVARCGPGDYFGERALMKSEPRAASLRAETDMTLLKLDRNAFSLLLGPLEDLMKQKFSMYDLSIGDLKRSRSQAAPEGGEPAPGDPQAALPAPKKGVHIPFSDLTVIGTLGKGSFGHVQLVKDKSGATYALKAVSKAQIVQTGQTAHIMSEKRVMERLDHPFLIKLFQTYKDRDRLYFLLEASLGGELFSVLREHSFFQEPTARFYAGCVVLAFEYLHERNIIYRDLKPENLLLDARGYLKITDFGFAKDISDGRTYTLCGTPDYLAPEIVAGKGHGKGVDWWTLGVFVYEMLASVPPFYSEDPMKTYARIMNGKIVFPDGSQGNPEIKKDAQSLIKKLLNPKPSKRIGVVKGGASLIKKHAWFKGADFDFDDLIAMKLTPAVIPKIKNTEDLSNFDAYDDDDDPVEPYVDNGTGWDDEF